MSGWPHGLIAWMSRICFVWGFILRHPLNRGHSRAALVRWPRWQLGSRLLPGPVVSAHFISPDFLRLSRANSPGLLHRRQSGARDFTSLTRLQLSQRPQSARNGHRGSLNGRPLTLNHRTLGKGDVLRVPSMRNHETLTGLVRETDQRSLVQESHATASNLRQGFRGTSPIFPLMLVRGRYDSRPGVHPDR
jgi:hypothetical protein